MIIACVAMISAAGSLHLANNVWGEFLSESERKKQRITSHQAIRLKASAYSHWDPKKDRTRPPPGPFNRGAVRAYNWACVEEKSLHITCVKKAVPVDYRWAGTTCYVTPKEGASFGEYVWIVDKHGAVADAFQQPHPYGIIMGVHPKKGGLHEVVYIGP